MGDLQVIACVDSIKEHQEFVPRRILSISSVLEGFIRYIDKDPQRIPPGIRRYGPGTLTLNNERDVVKTTLEYLRHAHNGREFTVQPSDRGVVFLVRLYKLALSLGYDFQKPHMV